MKKEYSCEITMRTLVHALAHRSHSVSKLNLSFVRLAQCSQILKLEIREFPWLHRPVCLFRVQFWCWSLDDDFIRSRFFRAPDIPSAALILLLLISAWRRSHVSCLRLIIVFSRIDCARTAWNVKQRQCNTICWRKSHLSADLQRQVLHILRVLGPIRCPEILRAKRTLGQSNKA